MQDWIEFLKVCSGATAACTLIGTVGIFTIKAFLRKNNDELMDRFNGRYLKRELYEERNNGLNQKLDLIHAFQKDRFEELAEVCAAVESQQGTQNTRLAVIEDRLRIAAPKKP